MKKTTLNIIMTCCVIACSGPENLKIQSQSSKIEVTGYLDPSKIKTSSTHPLNNTDEVELRIEGKANAGTPHKKIIAINLRSEQQDFTTVASDGSFILELLVLLADPIQIFLEDTSTTAVLLASSEAPANEDNSENPPIDSPNDPVDDDPLIFPTIGESGINIIRLEIDEPPTVDVTIELATVLESGFLEVINSEDDHSIMLSLSQELEESSIYSGQIPADQGETLYLYYIDGDRSSFPISQNAP